jgi:hypothetical protein
MRIKLDNFLEIVSPKGTSFVLINSLYDAPFERTRGRTDGQKDLGYYTYVTGGMISRFSRPGGTR